MPRIAEIHPDTSQSEFMPYAPAVKVQSARDLVFISGATASPLYHQHPHVAEEHVLPDDIKQQTHMAMANIKLVLDHQRLSWRHIVKVTKYVTDMREADDMHVVLNEYFGDWRPASTLVAVSNLSSPGARVELDMMAIRLADDDEQDE